MQDLRRAIRVMDDFADRTGVTSSGPSTRYLWTDAFAVCNWLGLYEATGEDRFLELCEALIEQVHEALGRHRSDDPRSGWISGLPEAEGARRPTAGGLRIGKPRPEKAPGEPYDPQAEWDRDGQYYHYLTRWMLALWRSWRVTGDAERYRQAVDLARAAHAGFTTGAHGERRLVWKMSIDLSRPLVASSGHLDPLDGLVTSSLLVAGRPEGEPPDLLAAELAELEEMCRGRSWVTDDPLGVGGLLVNALRCHQLAARGHATGVRHLAEVVADAGASLDALTGSRFAQQPPERRLAFRELGLVIGLEAAVRMENEEPLTDGPSDQTSTGDAVAAALGARAASWRATGDEILDLWSREGNRRAPTWRGHRDISEVMWATALHPRGFLDF